MSDQTRPAPVVTDEAVIRAHDALQERWGPVSAVPILHSDIRAALEAAAPLLGPRPLLDREAVHSIVYEAELPDQIVDGVMALARPMPTREEIAGAMHDVDNSHAWGSADCVAHLCQPIYLDLADAVLALISGGAK